jgi:hypothetical protein
MSEIRILRIWGKEGTVAVLYLYLSLNVIWVIKLKKIRWVEYIIYVYGVRYVRKTTHHLKGRDHLEDL